MYQAGPVPDITELPLTTPGSVTRSTIGFLEKCLPNPFKKELDASTDFQECAGAPLLGCLLFLAFVNPATFEVIWGYHFV
jgi:hypothetical protein